MGLRRSTEGAVLSEIVTVGLELAKNVFQAHGADATVRAVLRKKLPRDQVLDFFGRLPSCVVAMDACGDAHFRGREIGKLGHEVRLIPPACVKPFVKRQTNDGEADRGPSGVAQADERCRGASREAAARPAMRFVPVRNEGTRGAAMVFRIRGC